MGLWLRIGIRGCNPKNLIKTTVGKNWKESFETDVEEIFCRKNLEKKIVLNVC